jgi:hypothetical protein
LCVVGFGFGSGSAFGFGSGGSAFGFESGSAFGFGVCHTPTTPTPSGRTTSLHSTSGIDSYKLHPKIITESFGVRMGIDGTVLQIIHIIK